MCVRVCVSVQLRGYNTAVTGDDGVERDTAINEAADMLGQFFFFHLARV